MKRGRMTFHSKPAYAIAKGFNYIASLFGADKPKKVEFIFIKESYDKDLTVLGFLNQMKAEFNEQADKFNEQLEREIAKEAGTK